MTASTNCPNCGANVADDGVSDVMVCRFCGTSATPTRARLDALQAERERLLARLEDWSARMEQAAVRRAQDYIVPPAGCCGIYVAVFVAGSALLAAIGLAPSTEQRAVIAALSILSAVIGALVIFRRREARRNERLLALQRERQADRQLLQTRLAEIEAECEALREH